MRILSIAAALAFAGSAAQAMTYNWPTDDSVVAAAPEVIEFSNVSFYMDDQVLPDSSRWRLNRVPGKVYESLGDYSYELEALSVSDQILTDVGASAYSGTGGVQYYDPSRDGTSTPVWGIWGGWWYELYLSHKGNGLWEMSVDYFVNDDPNAPYRGFLAYGVEVTSDTPAPVPLPASFVLLLAALGGLTFSGSRARSQAA